MRIFQERDDRSSFYGEHIIYDSSEEFEREKPGMPWKIWGHTDIEDLKVGEWIRADDGYMIQILRMKRFAGSTGQDTYFIRVPMGTFAVYMTKKKGWVWRQLFAQFSVPHKGSISQRSRTYHGGHIQKIKFATLLISGVNLSLAVKMCYPNLHRQTKTQLIIKAATLMDDIVVRSEIRTQLAKFRGDIEGKFGDERLLDELDLLLERSKKGTDSHRTNIQFIMELRGLYEPIHGKSSKKLKSMQEANFTEVPPSESEK